MGQEALDHCNGGKDESAPGDSGRTVVYTNRYRLNLTYREAYSLLLRDVYHFRSLIWQYFRRDFVSSYRGTFLGVLWRIILPLVPASVYIVLQHLGVFSEVVDMPRALYVASGLAFWTLWSSSLSVTMNRPDSQSYLIKKVKVPLAVVYLTGMGQVLFDFALQMGLVIVLMLAYRTGLGWNWLLLPVLFLPVAMFGFGLGLLLSFFNPFVRDLKNVVVIILRYGLFASAVVFPLPMHGWVRLVVTANPMYHFIEGSRQILVRGDLNHPVAYFAWTTAAFAILAFALKKIYSVEHRLVAAL